jgi:hypothetical protein
MAAENNVYNFFMLLKLKCNIDQGPAKGGGRPAKINFAALPNDWRVQFFFQERGVSNYFNH